MTQTISTIVDLFGFHDVKQVYMTQTISTIVDEGIYNLTVCRLYDPNNFYYCRYWLTFE